MVNMFKNFIGQEQMVDNLCTFISSAAIQNKSVDHVLITGPCGLGKTSIAVMVAQEYQFQSSLETMWASCVGAQIKTSEDLIQYFRTFTGQPVFLFIDEIHRLKPAVQEVLYVLMQEGFFFDTYKDKKEQVRRDVENFTIIGATTNPGLLSKPLRDRFGIQCQLELYGVGDLFIIVRNYLQALCYPIYEQHPRQWSFTDEGLMELAQRSRGTPRVAKNLSKRLLDFIVTDVEPVVVDKSYVERVCMKLHIDSLGLDDLSVKYLRALLSGKASLNTLAGMTGEITETLEEVVEPFLLHSGLIVKTGRGRQITTLGRDHLSKGGLRIVKEG